MANTIFLRVFFFWKKIFSFLEKNSQNIKLRTFFFFWLRNFLKFFPSSRIPSLIFLFKNWKFFSKIRKKCNDELKRLWQNFFEKKFFSLFYLKIILRYLGGSGVTWNLMLPDENFGEKIFLSIFDGEFFEVCGRAGLHLEPDEIWQKIFQKFFFLRFP